MRNWLAMTCSRRNVMHVDKHYLLISTFLFLNRFCYVMLFYIDRAVSIGPYSVNI